MKAGDEGGGIAQQLVDDDELYAGIGEEVEERLQFIGVKNGAAFEIGHGEFQYAVLARGQAQNFRVLAGGFLDIGDGLNGAAAEPGLHDQGKARGGGGTARAEGIQRPAGGAQAEFVFLAIAAAGRWRRALPGLYRQGP